MMAACALIATAFPAFGKEAPSNDDFVAATPVTGLPFSTTVDLTGAGLELGEAQPSCRRARSSVWFRFTPETDVNVAAETTSGIRHTITVYSGTAVGDLFEESCAGGGVAEKVEFRAFSDHTYFIQLGSAGRRQGLVDLQLSPATWQQKTLTVIRQAVEKEGTSVPILKIHGRPRPSNPSIYDITVTAHGQPPVTRSILTFGLVKEDRTIELLNTSGHSGSLEVTLGYRYDRTQYQCVSDEGEGSSCTASSPIQDLQWLTGGDGQRAELTIGATLLVDDIVKVQRSVTVPYAGQVVGLLP